MAEAVFKVKATGDKLHLRWQKDRYSDTDTLHIVKIRMSDEGRYRCIVMNHLGTKPSDEASLTVSKLMQFVCQKLFTTQDEK